MPEVPDHLVPTDGLTRSSIRFAGMDTHPVGGGANMRFDIYDEEDGFVGTLSIRAKPTQKGTVDAMIVQAYRRLTDIVRGWLYHVDQMREGYEKKVVR